MKRQGQYVTIDKLELRILRTFLGGDALGARYFLKRLPKRHQDRFVKRFPEILGPDIDRTDSFEDTPESLESQNS